MNPFQAAVTEFHEATGGRGTIFTEAGQYLRGKLILEEAVETVAALGFIVNANMWTENPRRFEPVTFFKEYKSLDLLDFIDGLCDLTYVVMGGAVNAGIDLEPHFNEVHAANMRKLEGPKRADGKQLKPTGWVGPDHARVLSDGS